MERPFRRRLPDLQASSLPDRASWQVWPSAAQFPCNGTCKQPLICLFGLHVSFPTKLSMWISSSFLHKGFVWQSAYQHEHMLLCSESDWEKFMPACTVVIRVPIALNPKRRKASEHGVMCHAFTMTYLARLLQSPPIVPTLSGS